MNRRRSPAWALSSLVLTTLMTGRAAAVQRPLNLDFELPSISYADRPWGWTLGWSAFGAGPGTTFTLDSVVRYTGKRSLRLGNDDTAPAATPPAIMLQLPADFARGRSVRLTGWIRSDTSGGRALMTLEAWQAREVAAADTASVGGTAAPGAGPRWTRHDLRIAVPKEPTVHSIVVSLALDGSGSAWFDGLTLAIDGVPLTRLPATVKPPSGAELAWLRRQATQLRSVQVSDTPRDEDLRLLADIVGPARIVALGESTHGTHEFFLMKHRLVEYLVRQHGFRVFAIEANQLAVEKTNRYVRGDSGTARDAMRVMFRVWNTEEMLDLVEWIRAYNLSHPTEMVRFAGYDMQDQRTPADTLRAFLARVEPTLLPVVDSLIGEYRAQPSYATPQVPDTTRARWAVQADTLWSLLGRHRAAWLAHAPSGSDTLAVEWGLQAANLIRQAAGFNVALNSPERDSLMAANLDWFLRTVTPGERAVVWAHDVHVSHGGDVALSFNGGAQMGAYLKRAYGPDYRAFSLLTFDGAYSAARSFSDHQIIAATAFPGPHGSVEAALHRLDRPPTSVGWIVDLRAARTESTGEWLRRSRPIRHIGYAVYDYGFESKAVLPLEFDGIVFVDHTTPSRLLR